MTAAWQTALAYALTGSELEFDTSERPEVEALLAGLAAHGWTPQRVAEHARATVEGEQPWPHPVPSRLREGTGAAQLHAALNRARAALGVAVLETRAPSTRRRLNADEERLMREVPPHHGS